MTIFIFLAVLLVCVIAHEWGHFFAARKFGMLVEEFGFGIPPRLWSWKKGETKYSINALPVGGFVKIAGENGVEEGIPANRQFDFKPWWQQGIVLVAGVVCNMLLAFLLFTLAYKIGMPSATTNGVPTIVSVSEGLPADEAGLVVGDKINKITVDGKEVLPVSTDVLREHIQNNGKEVKIEYIRAGETKEVVLMPKEQNNSRMIGIAVETIGIVEMNLWQSMKAAWFQMINITTAIWDVLTSLIGQLFGGDKTSVGGLVGPVGLAKEVKGAATIGFTYLLAFTAAISVNLAVLNILPFPALDGGRLLVVLMEAIFRRKFSKKIVGLIHASGFIILIGLMVVLTIGDIRKIL